YSNETFALPGAMFAPRRAQWQQQTRRLWQWRDRLHDGVEIEREAGGRFVIAAEIAPAAAQLAAHAQRKHGEADAGLIFEAAILDWIDREFQRRRRRAQQ